MLTRTLGGWWSSAIQKAEEQIKKAVQKINEYIPISHVTDSFVHPAKPQIRQAIKNNTDASKAIAISLKLNSIYFMLGALVAINDMVLESADENYLLKDNQFVLTQLQLLKITLYLQALRRFSLMFGKNIMLSSIIKKSLSKDHPGVIHPTCHCDDTSKVMAVLYDPLQFIGDAFIFTPAVYYFGGPYFGFAVYAMVIGRLIAMYAHDEKCTKHRHEGLATENVSDFFLGASLLISLEALTTFFSIFGLQNKFMKDAIFSFLSQIYLASIMVEPLKAQTHGRDFFYANRVSIQAISRTIAKLFELFIKKDPDRYQKSLKIINRELIQPLLNTLDPIRKKIFGEKSNPQVKKLIEKIQVGLFAFLELIALGARGLNVCLQNGFHQINPHLQQSILGTLWLTQMALNAFIDLTFMITSASLKVAKWWLLSPGFTSADEFVKDKISLMYLKYNERTLESVYNTVTMIRSKMMVILFNKLKTNLIGESYRDKKRIVKIIMSNQVSEGLEILKNVLNEYIRQYNASVFLIDDEKLIDELLEEYEETRIGRVNKKDDEFELIGNYERGSKQEEDEGNAELSEMIRDAMNTPISSGITLNNKPSVRFLHYHPDKFTKAGKEILLWLDTKHDKRNPKAQAVEQVMNEQTNQNELPPNLSQLIENYVSEDYTKFNRGYQRRG